ncbi:unnamed protein product [Cyprideis torosa]|uniref:Uncharacterized protein n=1 Tax=Cyprideis torosa TaxID=163714 RepID=A0A7R8WEC8_9CRUS|nr:unnamed protein product [Cyprideis torosa]CAG0895588.1 unnamed protein product [Cyprideis torosa]
MTEDGFEYTFQVNHLAQMYLTLLLSPLLNTGSRVISISSESHRFSSLNGELTTESLCPTAASNYSLMSAYNNSKLLNLWMVQALHQRWFESRGIAVNGVHPGNMVMTEITRHSWLVWLLFLLVRPFTKSLQQAAATSVFAAASPDTTGLSGCYFNNCFPTLPSKAVQNLNLTEQAWKLSMKMLIHATQGTTPPIPKEFL